MRFRVLGPVALHTDHWQVPGPGLRSTLLGSLLAARSGTVSADALVHAMWGESPGEGARSRLQVHVHRLRRLLGQEDQLVQEGPGYRLILEPGDLDADTFDDLADRVLERRGTPAERARWATDALDLWHGAAYDGAAGELAEAEAARLTERRSAVLEAKFAAHLELGEHRAILDEVLGAARAEPLHEGLQAQLMATLAAAGRRSDALAAYRATRSRLVEELGIEPGHELRRLHEAILLGAEAEQVQPPRPYQLPLAPPALVGREAELAELDEATSTGAAGVALVLTGAPGVGKTALALTWAHTRAERFPDGQLYVDLQGFGPHEPLAPARVLPGFLRALGAPADAHTWPLGEQTNLLRSLVHGRHLLVLLDNAASAEQVRPLLAASAGCTVLVTSRLTLGALALQESSHTIDVPALTEARARELLAGVLGPGTPQELQPLLDCCAGLPLALTIVAERARATPGASTAELVAQIAGSDDRMDRFDLGEEGGSLRSILTWSYRSLTEEAQLVFRSIGCFPGRGPDVGALAAISGLDHRAAARAVDELVRAHLVTAEDVALRQHDLLGDLAAELAREHGPALEEQTATRLVAYWAVRAAQARPRFVPERSEPLEVPELDRVQAPNFADDEQARRWTWHHLRAMADAGRLVPEPPYAPFDHVLMVLSRMMVTISAATGASAMVVALTAAAQQAAERSGDVLDVIRARVQHATALPMGEGEAAVAALRAAVALALEHDLPDQAATATGNLGVRMSRAGEVSDAIAHSEEAARLAALAGHELQANFWRCNVAAQTLTLGDLAAADRHARLALEEARRLGSDRETTAACAVRADVALQRGDLDAATSWANQAADRAQATGLVFREADAESLFGSIAARTGDIDTANDHFSRAVALATRVGRWDTVVQTYLSWAEALAARGSADARSCLSEAGAVARRSLEPESLAAVHDRVRQVEGVLATTAS